MATVTLQYATHAEFKSLLPYINEFDTKQPIYNWNSLSNNIYEARNTGLVTQLYSDGLELFTESSFPSATASVKTTSSALVASPQGSVGVHYSEVVISTSDHAFVVGSIAKMGDEKMLITKIAESTFDTLTVRRGFAGTTPTAHSSGADIGLWLKLDKSLNWYYSSHDDLVLYYSETDPNELVIESGQDWSTLVTNSLINATMELNSMLDSRFPIPIPKTMQYSNTVASDTPEYDFIIKKLTCYLAGVNLIRATNPGDERANDLQEQIDAIMDRLNRGDIKLRCEIDAQDKNGEIIVGPSNAGTMYLVETYCEEWIGAPYDKIEIECKTTGVYGTAKIDVKALDSEKLSGTNILTDHKVTGGLQHIGNNLWIRFEGNSMTDGDKWWIPIRQRSLNTTNTQVSTLRAIRI